MFSHKQLWSAIDALAQQNDISVSRLARNAGLDPTTFNKSKRLGTDGRPRWPSTESLHKIMDACGITIHEFVVLLENKRPVLLNQLLNSEKSSLENGPGQNNSLLSPPLPQLLVLDLDTAQHAGHFDDKGWPITEVENSAWDYFDFPFTADQSFALEVSDDDFLPLYRAGDRLIVCIDQPIRRGDRLVIQAKDGDIGLYQLRRQTANRVDLQNLAHQADQISLDIKAIKWMARIIGVTQ